VRLGVRESSGRESVRHLLGTGRSAFGSGLAGEGRTRIREGESRAKDRSD
jgi:hypothetical protein